MPSSVPTVPDGRRSAAVDRLRRSVLEGPGHTDAELRQKVAAYAADLWRAGATTIELPGELGPYVSKVALASYKVTDEDVDALRSDGLSEDEIMELTLAGAAGCGLAALAVGIAAARGGR